MSWSQDKSNDYEHTVTECYQLFLFLQSLIMWRQKVFHSISDFSCLLTSKNEETEKIILFLTLRIPIRFVFGSKVLQGCFHCADFYHYKVLIWVICFFFFLRLVGKSLLWEFISVNQTGEFIICDYICKYERSEYVSLLIFMFQRADLFKKHCLTILFCRKV